MKKKGEIKMAVLARPINLSFELDKDKAEAFFRSNKRGMVNKAIERAENHKSLIVYNNSASEISLVI